MVPKTNPYTSAQDLPLIECYGDFREQVFDAIVDGYKFNIWEDLIAASYRDSGLFDLQKHEGIGQVMSNSNEKYGHTGATMSFLMNHLIHFAKHGVIKKSA